MRCITRHKLACVLALFLLVSLFFAAIQGTSLTGGNHFLLGLVAHIVSVSAGNEGFVITIVAFCATPFILRFTTAQKKLVLASFMLILACGYGIKTSLKSVTHQPRPYIETLVNLGAIGSVEQFYALSNDVKQDVVESVSVNVNKWRLQEWVNESDYSFPSGHMLFAASVAIFWGSVFLLNGHFAAAAVTVIWASSVGGSRLWLGMHRLEDLYASAFIAFLLCIFVPFYVRFFYRRFGQMNNEVNTPNTSQPRYLGA